MKGSDLSRLGQSLCIRCSGVVNGCQTVRMGTLKGSLSPHATEGKEAGMLCCQTANTHVPARSVDLLTALHVDAVHPCNPGLLVQGPREDAGGGSSSVNVGARLASAMYDFTRQFGAGTRIVMSGIRTVEEALQLSGADYLVLSDKLQAKLAAEETLQVRGI